MGSMTRPQIYSDISNERERQIEKWGTQHLSISQWLTILGEEYGEACKEGIEYELLLSDDREDSFTRFGEELIHVAAVAVQILEHL